MMLPEHDQAAPLGAQKRMAYLLNAAPAVIYSFEATGEYRPTYISENIRELLGYEPSEYLEDPAFWYNRVHPEDVKRVTAEFERLLKQKQRACEYRFQRKDGSYCWVSDQQRLICDADGAAREVVGSWSDISERKRAEKALSVAQEETLRAQTQLLDSLESISEGFAFYDPDDRLVFCNTRYREILYPGMQDLVTPGTPFEKILRRAAELGLVHEAEGRIDAWVAERLAKHREPAGAHVQEQGNGRWIQINERKTEEGGTVGVYTDITGTKRAQQFLQLNQVIARAANEATTVDEALQTAVDQVCSHTGWPVGHVYILADDRSIELRSTKLWHLEDSERFEPFRKVTEATSFTEGVGLPGRVLANGKPTLIVDVTKDRNLPRAKVATVVGVKGALAFPVLIGRDVVAVLEFFSSQSAEPDEPLLDVMAQIGTELGRVIERKRAGEKLLAVKEAAEAATQAKSAFLTNMSHEIADSFSELQLLFGELAVEQEATHADDGVHRGAFSQIDASTTRRHGGTGTTFPIQAQAAALDVDRHLHELQPDLEGRRLLIVEDNATNRRILTLHAQAWGMKPIETAEPKEALEWLQRGDPFDIAIVDMQMPGMDGFALAREIREIRNRDKLPLVMLSSTDGLVSCQRAPEVDRYLSKPIKPSQLLNELMSVFAGKPVRVLPRPEKKGLSLRFWDG